MYFYFMKKLFFNKGSYKKYIKVNCLKLVSGKLPPEKFPPEKFPPTKLLLGEFPPTPHIGKFPSRKLPHTKSHVFKYSHPRFLVFCLLISFAIFYFRSLL